MTKPKTKIVSILGPTASGKTELAVQLAKYIHGEIISVDSRQIYKNMNLGTGKDYDTYENIPYHLIDILPPGEYFSVALFKKEAHKILNEIILRKTTPILCGGTGYYLKALIESYPFNIPPSEHDYIQNLERKSREELYEILKQKNLWESHHWKNDSKRRMARAIEKQFYSSDSKTSSFFKDHYKVRLFCVNLPRPILRKKIYNRILDRINQGMIEEVKSLKNSGITDAQMERFGLEYRWINRYLNDQIPYHSMIEKLHTEICRFAKRQVTFIRYMKKQGFHIEDIQDIQEWKKQIREWLNSEGI